MRSRSTRNIAVKASRIAVSASERSGRGNLPLAQYDAVTGRIRNGENAEQDDDKQPIRRAHRGHCVYRGVRE